MSLDNKRRWTAALAILNMGLGSYDIELSFALELCSSSNKQVKTARLQTAVAPSFKAVGMVSTRFQREQLRRKVRFLVVSEQVTNVILGMAFIVKYIEGISPKPGSISPCDSSPVAVVDETRHDCIVDVLVTNVTPEDKNSTDEHSWVVSRKTKLSPMGVTTVQSKTLYGGIQLVTSSRNSFLKRVVLVRKTENKNCQKKCLDKNSSYIW